MKKLVEPIFTLLNSLYKYSIAAILIFIPLYPKFPLFTVPGSYVAVRAEDFLILLAWGIFFLKLLFDQKLKWPKITFQIGVYLGVALLSCLSAILVTHSANTSINLLHFFRRVEYLSIFFLVYFASQNSSSRKYYLELAILPCIGVLLYGIAQIFFNAPVISTMDSESSKGIALTLRPGVMLNSTFAGHYDLAIYLIMMMTFLISLSFMQVSKLKKYLIILPFVALSWLFMQAGSRIGLLGLVLSISVLSYFYRQYLLGFVYLCIVFATIFTSPQYLNRFKSIYSVFKDKISYTLTSPVYAAESSSQTKRSIQKDTSTSIRFDVEWPRAMRAFYKNPFLGTGYSSISLATDNDYLRSLGETGLLGLISFIAIIIALFKKLISLSLQNKGLNKMISVSALGILIAFSTSAMFIDVFESSKIAILFWGFMGLAFSVDSNLKDA